MAKQENRDLELELLKAKLELVEGKVTKPKTSEEEFQERLAKYEASKPAREELTAKIEARRMELMYKHPKARIDEIIVLEAWERRIEQTKKSDANFSNRLKYEYQRKINEINTDYTR